MLTSILSAEDLIIHKLFAGRGTDLEDAAGVARGRADTLDRDYLERWAEAYAEAPGREDLPERLRRLLDAADG